MKDLRIDPEFESLIPPLSDEEFKQLRDNILNDGEVLNPIITWQGTICDGHNRWKIIKENPGIPYKTYELIFLDRYQAKEWIIRNQLGRRNITNEQRLRLIGQMQENRKKSHGNNAKRDDTGKYLMGQNEPTGDKSKSTAAQIAEEVGVSESTVKRAEKFSKGIDALSEVSKEAADKVLKGGSGITKAEIMSVPLMEPQQREEFAERVINPQPKEERKVEKHQYSVEDLVKEIESNGWNFTKHLKDTLVFRSTLYEDYNDRLKVRNAVNSVKQDLEIILGLLNKEM